MGVGDVEVDLSAAVWRLQYNLGPGFGLGFLNAYGRMDATDRDVDRLWSMDATSGAKPWYPPTASHARPCPCRSVARSAASGVAAAIVFR
jgi:hypothetical protein